jgi:hypothetical protein
MGLEESSVSSGQCFGGSIMSGADQRIDIPTATGSNSELHLILFEETFSCQQSALVFSLEGETFRG